MFLACGIMCLECYYSIAGSHEDAKTLVYLFCFWYEQLDSLRDASPFASRQFTDVLVYNISTMHIAHSVQAVAHNPYNHVISKIPMLYFGRVRAPTTDRIYLQNKHSQHSIYVNQISARHADNHITKVTGKEFGASTEGPLPRLISTGSYNKSSIYLDISRKLLVSNTLNKRLMPWTL